MILLEPGNRILGETCGSQINLEEGQQREAMSVRLCDFDDVMYKVEVKEGEENNLRVSMAMPCYREIKDFGGEAALNKYYEGLTVEAEVSHDITVSVDLTTLADAKAREECVTKLSMIKSNVLGGVFSHFFDGLLEGKKCDNFKFNIRADTAIYFVPMDDRVVIIYAVDFTDKVDKAIAKVFMQEFADARKRLGRAPPCSWKVDPPRELVEGFGIEENQGNLGYLSFAVMKGHVDKGKKEGIVQVMQSFRNYIQYHITCSKSFFHSRMRGRVKSLLQVLNRAKVIQRKDKKIKKTMSGKTFKR